MKIIGYIRVSTDKQDYENQKHGILEYCNRNKITGIEFVEETISSRVTLEKRDIWRVINELEDGDILITAELSRLGRSIMEIMTIFKMLAEKNVITHIIKGGFKIGDKKDSIYNSVLIFAFGLAAEIERELISQRTKEALARKKADGMKLGRPRGSKSISKLEPHKDKILELYRSDVSFSALARIYNVNRLTMSKFVKESLKNEDK